MPTAELRNHELAMMQLSDSFFPSGMFGMSGGLESMSKARRLKGKKAILGFMQQQIQFQIAPCDCAAMSIAIDAASRRDMDSAMRVDNAYFAMKLVSEARVASVRSGRQVLNCITQISAKKFASKFKAKVDSGDAQGTYPVCMAIGATMFGIPKTSALRMALYSYCVSVAAAAVRLGILQHLEAQAVLKEMHPMIDSEAIRASLRKHNSGTDPLAVMWQLSPLVDILQMQHERDDLRMFIT